MLRLILVAALFVPALAWAQSVPPSEQAAQSMLMDALQAEHGARTQVVMLQAQIADLQKQLADAKAKQEPR